MHEELKKLRESVHKVEMRTNTLDAKVGYLRESTQELKESAKDMAADLDAFIDVYTRDWEKVNHRIDRLEKHTGLE